MLFLAWCPSSEPRRGHKQAETPSLGPAPPNVAFRSGSCEHRHRVAGGPLRADRLRPQNRPLGRPRTAPLPRSVTLRTSTAAAQNCVAWTETLKRPEPGDCPWTEIRSQADFFQSGVFNLHSSLLRELKGRQSTRVTSSNSVGMSSLTRPALWDK